MTEFRKKRAGRLRDTTSPTTNARVSVDLSLVKGLLVNSRHYFSNQKL